MRKHEPPPESYVSSAIHRTIVERLDASGITSPTREQYFAVHAEVTGGPEPPPIETAQERALRRTRENEIDAAVQRSLRESGALREARSAREARERYLDEYERAAKSHGVEYGRPS